MYFIIENVDDNFDRNKFALIHVSILRAGFAF